MRRKASLNCRWHDICQSEFPTATQIQLSDQFSSWGVESKELRSERSYCAMVEE